MYTIRLEPARDGWLALIESDTARAVVAGETREKAVTLAFTMIWLQIRLTPRRRRVSLAA